MKKRLIIIIAVIIIALLIAFAYGKTVKKVSGGRNNHSQATTTEGIKTVLTLKNDLEGNGTRVIYYPGSNIVKEEFRIVNEYRYEFGVVTDDDVTVPDYTGYEIKYINQDNFGL